MGIDLQSLRLLVHARKYQEKFGQTLTIGRQGVHCSQEQIAQSMGVIDYTHSEYCEPFLIKYFGASEVDSLDASDYENATIVFDLNRPVPDTFAQYDTVFDSGSLEHVFNIPVALANLSRLCREGGQILHVLPANNHCGHGFWQMSPELFFTLYSEKNGYKNTQVFLAETYSPYSIQMLQPPPPGQRHNISGSAAVYLLVRTERAARWFNHSNVQQSDYLYHWSRTK